MTRRHVTERDFRDEPVDRPATWFMPHRNAGPSETYQRKGYVLRVSGDTAALRERLGVEERRIPREFCCPVHGRFTREVDGQTEEVACAVVDRCLCLESGEARGQTCPVHDLGRRPAYCGLTSPWSPSRVGQGKSAGEMSG